MAKTGEIVRYLNDLLRLAEFKDYTHNGLQVEGCPEVEHIGFAVDACAETFEQLQDCQMIVVHHGLWWPAVECVTNEEYRRLKALLRRDINLYVAHLPLDRHPQVGNNAQILQKLGLEISGAFGEAGWYAELPTPVSADSLAAKFSQVVGRPAKTWLFGPSEVQRVAVCTGNGGQKMVRLAREMAMDMYLTGESGHTLYHLAKELEVNVAFGGHYGTEVFGVQALRPYLEEAFGVTTRFVDIPTGE